MKLDTVDEAVFLQNKKNIEEIVDKVIDDIEKEEEIEQIEKVINELEKEEEVSITNNKLYELQMDLKETLLMFKREELKIDNKILRGIENNASISTKIDKKYNKTVFALITSFFVIGVLFGIQDHLWMPYLSEFLDFAKTASNIAR